MRAENIIERLIARQCIADLLAAGFVVSVNDGEETTLAKSTDATAIVGAMFTTDEDWLYLRDTRFPDAPEGHHAWVRFVYGNSGWDVISDYTTNLEDALKRTLALTDDMQTPEGVAKIGDRFALSGAPTATPAPSKAYDLLAWCRTFITERHLNAEFEAHTGQTIDAIDDVLGPIGDASTA